MRNLLASLSLGFVSLFARAAEPPKEGAPAPALKALTQQGKAFDLADRKGKGWTVLYFYPKADTPGCTKQACAFRDSIKSIRDQNAEVYGVSRDSVEAVAKFHDKHHLSFDLLADAKGESIKEWGVAMPVIGIARRWTFIVDPELRVRHVDKDVDPVKDPERTSNALRQLQAAKP